MITTAALAVMFVGFQAPQENAAPWRTVVSKEGQFVVDFPTDPTKNEVTTKTGPGGRLKIVEVDCETPAVVYIAQRITLPTAIVKGAEGNMLVAFRDYFAKTFNGKVISEKKVRFEGSYPGLDFTIRAQPERGVVAMVRIRQYLSGQAIYALIAASAANRELPEDAGRFFGSFAIGTKRIKKTGPKAETEGKALAGWGNVVDPDGDCKIGTEGKALVMNIPGTLHDLNADIDKYNAPRVLREVEGNFVIQVKVVGDFKPGPKAMRAKGVPFNGGGIFVWRDSDNYIRLERGAMIKGGKLGSFAIFEEREGGSSGAQHNGQLTPGTTYLRLERRGSRILGFTSKDGSHWTQLKPIDTVWPSQLKVGVDAINSSNEPFKVRFEELTFKGKAPEGS
jgi:regulation of enolase protein 1 (concanavalin A-like superfamily)